MPPDEVAHYRLKERLGAGAMGEVWLAEDTRLHRLVALKMLPRKDAADAEAAARLLREARVASSLSHPNVAVVYDVGEIDDDGRKAAYVAMEYVKGRTLSQLLEGGRLATAAILPIARQVAEALADAHEPVPMACSTTSRIHSGRPHSSTCIGLASLSPSDYGETGAGKP